MIRLSFLAVVASIVLTACAGAPQNYPIAACTAVQLIDAQAKLIAPADGATGVPVSVGTITFSYSDPALSTGEVRVEPPSGSGGPAALIQNLGNGRAQATITTLQPNTKYTVRATSQATFGVCQTPVIGNLGSFTTQ